MTGVPEEVRFSATVDTIAQCVYDSVVELATMGKSTADPSIIMLAKMYLQAEDNKQKIENFIVKSHEKCWNMILARNEEFFVKEATTLFSELPVENVDMFLCLFTGNNQIDAETKTVLWELFESLVKIAIKYVHRERQPATASTGEKYYRNPSFMPKVALKDHAKAWELNLSFPLVM
jgi:hypothetical protein